MRISLQQLESVLSDECVRTGIQSHFGAVSPDVYALLYIAAREGSVEIADAIFAARHCVRLLSFLISNVLRPDDIDQVRLVINHIDAQEDKSVLDYETTTMLAMFIARNYPHRTQH